CVRDYYGSGLDHW
nr:immunoglobulin heavy chain junction region [Macaca mulatta]MOV38186.1 immunoglobulin heavy chain junction region [Macaca mulatta]MOV38215.1 immunoglobulin heavy chain junction region [Macaca mulatta]MOV38266.1 immunoglobulin heavy chain junction region [Macaca mulatta]MOV38641.1 immunoglobulin heavy chain junction region [Macaca mulatta]